MKRYASLASLLLPILPTLLAGCYTYAPGEAASVQPGIGVRARVSPTAAARIEPLLGTSDARVLTGTIIENTGGTLVIEVPTAAQTGVGSATQSYFQRVTIAPTEVVSLDTRRLDRARTGAVVGAAAIVGLSAIANALKSSPTADKPPTGSTTDYRGIVLRLHF